MPGENYFSQFLHTLQLPAMLLPIQVDVEKNYFDVFRELSDRIG
jgi:hypothetical protein